MSLSQAAVSQLRTMLDSPTPQLIRIGVKNRGCSGLAYHLEYVDKPGAFDETVEQDGVRVLIDSKALFSIIGSEMDWTEDRLEERFVFKNPNISKSQLPCSGHGDLALTINSGAVRVRRVLQYLVALRICYIGTAYSRRSHHDVHECIRIQQRLELPAGGGKRTRAIDCAKIHRACNQVL